MDRHENLGRAARIDSEELGRGNPDNRERGVINQDRLSDRIRIRRETPLPPGVADDSHVSASTIILLIDEPSQDLTRAEAAVKIARYEFAARNFRLALNLHNKPAYAGKCKHAG